MAEVRNQSGRALGKTSSRQRRMRRSAQLRFISRVFPESERVAAVGLNRKGNIVERSEIRKQRRNLKRARQTQLTSPIGWKLRDFLAAKMDASAVWNDLPT